MSTFQKFFAVLPKTLCSDDVWLQLFSVTKSERKHFFGGSAKTASIGSNAALHMTHKGL
jgi:hypothetical protein